MKNGRHISQSFPVSVILAIVGGFFDSYTYICRGGVFANAQTGNIVLLGIDVSQGKFANTLHYLIPIISFVIGVFVVEYLKFKFDKSPKIHWHRIVILCEMVMIAIVGFIPAGYDTSANVIVSFVCAMQVEAFRKAEGNPFASTMCTGNLRSLSDCLFQYIKTGDKGKKSSVILYAVIIIFFIGGACIGAAATIALGVRAIFLSLIGLCAVFAVLCTSNEKNAQN